MAQTQLGVETVLSAARRHLAERFVCTFATSHGDVPWAASAFYVARDLDVFTCQRKDARTLRQMLANPRVSFAVDDRKAEAWLQALGRARPATPAEDNYPVIHVHVTELTFVDRRAGIVPRQHLILDGDEWRFA